MVELKVGQVFKNYKSICEWLGVEPSTGKSKQLHLKDFERYCLYHKEGQKFIIDEVFEEPHEKIDKRFETEYYDDIEAIVLNTLSKSKENHIVCSIGRALAFTNLVNKNFQYTRSNVGMSCKVLEIDEEYMYTFLNSTQTRFKKIFETALKSMAQRKLVDTEMCTIVCKNIPHIKYNELGEPVINENGNISCNIETVHEIATPEERRIIQETELNVLNKLGFNGRLAEKCCYLSGSWNEYKKMVNKIIKVKLNISYYYKGYSMVLNTNGLKREVNNINDNLTSINNKSCEAINKSTDKRLNIDNEQKEILVDILINRKPMVDVRKLVEKLINEEHKKETKNCHSHIIYNNDITKYRDGDNFLDDTYISSDDFLDFITH